MSKNPPHRPRKVIKEIWHGEKKEEYRKEMIKLAKQGAHVEEMLKVLPITRDSYYNLLKKEKEDPNVLSEEELDLCNTIKECYVLRKSWWTENLRESAFSDKKCNPALAIFYMKSAFKDDFKEEDKTVEKVIIQNGAKEGVGLDDK